MPFSIISIIISLLTSLVSRVLWWTRFSSQFASTWVCLGHLVQGWRPVVQPFCELAYIAFFLPSPSLLAVSGCSAEQVDVDSVCNWMATPVNGFLAITDLGICVVHLLNWFEPESVARSANHVCQIHTSLLMNRVAHVLRCTDLWKMYPGLWGRTFCTTCKVRWHKLKF